MKINYIATVNKMLNKFFKFSWKTIKFLTKVLLFSLYLVPILLVYLYITHVGDDVIVLFLVLLAIITTIIWLIEIIYYAVKKSDEEYEESLTKQTWNWSFRKIKNTLEECIVLEESTPPPVKQLPIVISESILSPAKSYTTYGWSDSLQKELEHERILSRTGEER